MPRNRRKTRETPWLPKQYTKTTMLQRVAIFLALKPGRFFTPNQLRREVSDGWPIVDKFCMQLATVGLADVKICCLRAHKWNCDGSEDLPLKGLDTPEHLDDLPTDQLAIVYSASKKLVALVESGEFLQMIKRRRVCMSEPVNHRVINELIDKHPEPVTIRALKIAARASECHNDLAYRLEHLALSDWVVIEEVGRPGWAVKLNYAFYGCARWKISLSAGGWLRIQRANQDGKPLAMPKPKPRKERLAEELAAEALAAEKRAANAK